jgi:hypothetical protein
VLAADLAPADLEHRAFAVLELRAGELVGLEDGDDAVDPRRTMQLQARDVLEVADGADDGHLVALAGMGARAHRFDSVDDGADLVLRRRLLHHDHHAECLSPAPKRYEGCPAEAVTPPRTALGHGRPVMRHPRVRASRAPS